MNRCNFASFNNQVYFIFLVAVFTIIALILSVNDGIFIYTLDDPYIHLAVAENILNGGYGVNPNEYSAPSSSIIWPYLLALIHLLSFKMIPLDVIPLFINIASSVATLWFICSFSKRNFEKHYVLVSSLLCIFFIVGVNLLGLLFLGMEHSLQILTLVAIAFYLTESRKDYPYVFYAFLVLAPLVRYENMAITFSVFAFLALSNNRMKALYAFTVSIILIAAFSIYLNYLGLGLLPTSILIKSGAMADSFASLLFSKISGNFTGSFTFTILYMLALFAFIRFKGTPNRLLIVSLLASMTLHLVFGRTGWFFRYEMYIIAYSALILVFVFKDDIKMFLSKYPLYSTVFFVIGASFINFGVIYSTVMSPFGSNNIYRQQHLLGEIAKSFNKPVAVNDLGLVSFNNNNYVLDLYGLASKKAMIARIDSDAETFHNLAVEHDVGLVMIYDEWFKKLPKEWKKVAILVEDRRCVVPILKTVSFYTTGLHDDEAISTLQQFVRVELLPSH